MLACLDELPSTAPLPTLRTRMANERALGISFVYAAQTWRQLTSIFGQDEAQALFGLTNVMVVFGGSKDVNFNRDISELTGTVRVTRTGWHTDRGGRNISADDIPVLRPEEVRQLPERQALVIAENGKPVIAKLHRCIDGRAGRKLLVGQRRLRQQLTTTRDAQASTADRAAAALAEAGRRNLASR
jgi:type IV secretion system protein VirD4